MNILYVGRFGCHGNQDEEAVAHSLRSLGHLVTTVEERAADRTADQMEAVDRSDRFDLCLFHKWDDAAAIARLRCPAVAWYWDLVLASPADPSLARSSAHRVGWMRKVVSLPRVVACLCSDGDWVDSGGRKYLRPQDAGKLLYLPQGADGRLVGPGTPIGPGPDVLFVGTRTGDRRRSHLRHLTARWKDQFREVGHEPDDRVHGRRLADLVCSAKVVVAPDGPSTDRYWSNRVWLVTGFRGLLLHPRCGGLDEFFTESQLVQYRSRDDLDEIIDYALTHPEWRSAKAKAGYDRTVRTNLYLHRAEALFRLLAGRV